MRPAHIALGSLAALVIAGGFAYVLWFAASTPVLDASGPIVQIWGCDNPRSENALGVCPRLRCEKALRDAGLVERALEIKVTGQAGHTHDRKAVMGGVVRRGKNTEPVMRFQCWLSEGHVVKAATATPSEWAQKRKSGEWQI